MRKETFVTIGLIFIILSVSVFGALNYEKPEILGLLNLFVLVCLVGLTGVYAYFTQKMAEEMLEQRRSGSLPLVIPTVTQVLNPITNTPNLDLSEIDYNMLQAGIQATLYNLGTGIAIDVRVSFCPAPMDSNTKKVQLFAPRKLGALRTSEQKNINFLEPFNIQLRDTPWKYQPCLKIMYQDIYERSITTVQEFRVENKRAFLGELYFTINGRRLGEEVTQK